MQRLLALSALLLMISSDVSAKSIEVDTFSPATLQVAQPAKTARAHGMTLSSPDFKPMGRLNENQVGCGGENLSPALTWQHVPAEAKSLALTMYDPDAPTGSGFWHWVVFNLPVTAQGLAAGAGSAGNVLPQGASTLNNDEGMAVFTGACPPVGDKPHRYIFTLYALSEPLSLPLNATPAVLGFTLNGKVIAKTQLRATYSR